MEREKITRKSFKYNFLKQIIVRLDFQGVLQAEMEEILLKIKPYLKSKFFNRYEEKINNEINLDINGIFQAANSIKEVKNIQIYTFINENKGYTIDISTNFICLKINAIKYSSFEEYSKVFTDIAQIYKEKIDFFTVKRFGLRKINFCFVKNRKDINRFFKKRYFDCYDLFTNLEVFASEKKENFSLDDNKVNILCDIERGEVNNQTVYKITLDSDIYIDQTDIIEKSLFNDGELSNLNSILFNIFVDALTDEFIEILINDDDNQSLEALIGVEKNE